MEPFKGRIMKLVFLGSPGAGKGTAAKTIVKKYQLIHISTGDIFREAVKNQTPLGLQVKDILNSGSLIPDELTIELVKARLQEQDAAGGYILDGFPRTLAQAEAFNQFARIDAVVNFTVEDPEVIIKRLTGRRICKSCNAIYHIYTNPPAKEGICDQCGAALYTREDDTITAVKQRLEVYSEQTAPLISYYEKLGLLRNIDASLTAEATEQQVSALLDTLKG